MITRERLLPAGLGLLAVSVLLRVVMPSSFNPESRAVVLLYELQLIAFWLAVMLVAAGLLATVLTARPADDPLGDRVSRVTDGQLLGAATGLLLVAVVVRALVTGVPGRFTRVGATVGEIGSVCFWLGLLAVGLVLARSLVRQRTS